MKIKLKKRSLITLIVVIVAISLVSGSFYVYFAKPYFGNVESVTVGLYPNEINSLVYIADSQQYFAANGLNVKIKDYSLGLTAVNSMINGDVDIATASEYIVVGKAFTNVSVCTFGTIAKSTGEYLVARTDAGISSVSDLKGKLIGLSTGTLMQFTLGTYLEVNGIKLNQVTLVNVSPSQIASALTNGTVDTVMATQPNISTIQNALGDKVVVWATQNGQPYYVDAICMESFSASHPEIIKRFLNSLVQAETFNINHQPQAMNIIATTLHYDPAYLESIQPDLRLTVSLDQSQVSAMEGEARWMITNNLTNQTVVPDFTNYIYLDGLTSVKPESVNIIR